MNRLSKKGFFLVATLTSLTSLTSLAFPAQANGAIAGAKNTGTDDVVTIAQGKPFIATTTGRQHFTESINLASGQEKLPLILTYSNGSKSQPGFQWIRINSSTMNYLTEKQFAGKQDLSIPVNGALASGGNQILVDAGGTSGATFDWKLTAPAPAVTGATSTNTSSGTTITVSGKNFSSDKNNNFATISNTNLSCLAATPTALTFQVPQGLTATDAQISVTTAGLKAGSTSISLKHSVPALTRMSATQVAPGSEITIYGGPFAIGSNQIKVTIGQFDAQVVSATADSIKVVAPMGFAGAPWGVNQPVIVWSNGVQARNSLTVNCYTGTVGGGYVSVDQ